MYFLKNSRCVLRKSRWLTSNIFERNFKITLGKSRVRWPEDDPTKPPLRLNIPKDPPVPDPYNFPPQIQINTAQTNINTANWLTREVRIEDEIPKNEIVSEKSTVEDRKNSSDNQNLSVKSKSSESLTENYPSEKVKNFKLKKIRSYEELTPNTLRVFDEKRSVLTIKIALNGEEDNKLVKGVSQVETQEDVTSDEQIRALAEAIVNELGPKMEESSDEAFLVIINVTNKDIPEETAPQAQMSAEAPIQPEKTINTFEDGFYGSQLQVRNFELRDERNVFKKKLGRSRKIMESDTPTVSSKQCSRSLESVLGNSLQFDAEFDRQVRDQNQYHPTWSFTRDNNRSIKSVEDLTKEKEKRKEVFESTIRRIRATRSQIPIGRKPQTMALPKKKLNSASTGTSREFFRSEPAEVTLTDEIPDVLINPEYKVLRKPRGEVKNIEDDTFKKSSTIRSYHNSCKNHCKVTKGIGEEKPPIVVMNLDKKRGNDSKGDGNNPKDGKSDPLRLTKDYSKTTLDNCDVLKKSSKLPDLKGSNDIYLQEGSVIDKKAQEEKTVRTTNNAKKEDDLNEERYEPDIADLTSPNGVKVPYSAAYPPNRALTGDERKSFQIFRDITSESFEMNVKCLSMDDVKLVGDGYGTSIAETPTNSTPKLSDNIVNIANEEITGRKGAPSVDTLSMMKEVKELVDMDLKNAEKIFLAGETEKNPVTVAPTECVTPMLLNSVVIHNEETNQYFINSAELEHASNTQKQELLDMKILDFNHEEFKGDFTINVYVPEEPQANTEYLLKTGESILVYDERSRKWNVDFDLLRVKEQTGRQQQKDVLNEVTPPEMLPEKPQKKPEPKENPLSSTITPEVSQKKDAPEKQTEPKRTVKKEQGNELDAKEILKKNSDLYDDVITGIKKPKKEEGEMTESSKWTKKADSTEKPPSEHYVSENIVEMSKNNMVKPRPNKVETVKLNITPKERPPSKVMEINLNKKTDEGKTKKDTKDGKRKPNGFYKKFEKYKTPFSDPEYEDKPMKINSDLDSNPNLKKLDSWNKTLVLQEISKSSENADGWLKDETDKMATLLLKVLQDAADGNTRRRVAGKTPGKGNPYEAIRKKQENNPGAGKGKKKEPGKKKAVPVQVKKSGSKDEKKNLEERSKKGQFPIIEDDSHVEILTPDSHLPKEHFQVPPIPLTLLNEKLTEDIPGPYLLKKISSMWRYLPDLGCQTTIFLLVRMFHIAKTGLSVFSSEVKKSRNDPFGRLFMKYGPVVKLQGPLSRDVVLINRPEDLNSVFVQERINPARSVLDSIENCRVRVRKKNFPLGITQSCNGIEWDSVRKTMIDVGNKGCLHYFNMLKTTDAAFVNKIQIIKNNQNQVPDDFINEVKKWSMEGLCGVLFDKSLGFLETKNSQIHWISESERLMRHLREATDHLSQCENGFQTWRFISTPSMRGLNQAYQSLDLIISKYVYQAELSLRKKKKALTTNKSNANKNLNFLESVLLNDKMAPDEITANLIDMFIIGVNTTTVALAFLLYNLAQNNRVQCLLFKEIKELLPTKTSTLNYHQLHSLKYLQACLKESLRLNIPIPYLLRVLPNDIALANYRVPYGTHVVMDTQTACMREQVFDDPERFKPERWIEQDCIHPFASFPFSNGPRADFVKRLAEIQLWTCAAQIVRNYQIEYHFGEIKSSKGVISFPDKPLRLAFVERQD